MLIEGEPGIGKSTLVRAACAEAAGLGCQVYWGAGDELGQALPLLPILDGLRVREPSGNPRQETIVALLRGEVASGRGEDVPTALAEQLLALVKELCAARPSVLVVDDLQWADHSSVTLWERLSRSARHLPLLLVGMMRPVPQREDLLALRHTADLAERFQLGGLPDEAVTELVGTLAGGKPDDELMNLADGAAGNPLYLTELVDALTRSSGLTVSDSGTAELTSEHAPESLPAAIADRLGFVPSPVREVLRAAALLGVDFAVSDLATVLGRSVMDLIPAFDEARAAGVLAESGSASRVPAPHDPGRPVRGDPGPGPGRLAPRGRPGARRRRAHRPTGWPGSCFRPSAGPSRSRGADGRVDPALAGSHGPSAGGPGSPRRRGTSRPRGYARHRRSHPSMTAWSAASPRPCTASATQPRRSG